MNNTIFGKKLLMIATITVLVTGLTLAATLDDAEAKKKQFTTPNVGDQFEIKAKGTGICTSDDGSVTAKVNVRFLLRVTAVDGEDFSGDGKVKIKLNTKCEGAPKQLVSDGQIAFTADSSAFNISGDLKAKDSTMFRLNADGEYLASSNGKTTIDLIMQLVGDNGIVIDATSAGTVGKIVPVPPDR